MLILTEKQREFYKNAKYVNKYKKIQKQPDQGEGSSQATKSIEVMILSLQLRVVLVALYFTTGGKMDPGWVICQNG